MPEYRRVMVLSPHADDGEIAAGGTIARFIEEGIDVHHVVFSSCEASVPEGMPGDILRQECRSSSKVLGIPPERLVLFDYEVRSFPSHRQEILEDLVKLNNRIKPQLVLAPSSSDLHQDHQVIYAEALRAFKTSASIWGYEHPWNNLSFTTDVFVILQKRHIDTKIKSLAQYNSQSYRPYFDQKYLRALAYTRGTQVHYPNAEAFELSRLIIE